MDSLQKITIDFTNIYNTISEFTFDVYYNVDSKSIDINNEITAEKLHKNILSRIEKCEKKLSTLNEKINSFESSHSEELHRKNKWKLHFQIDPVNTIRLIDYLFQGQNYTESQKKSELSRINRYEQNKNEYCKLFETKKELEKICNQEKEFIEKYQQEIMQSLFNEFEQQQKYHEQEVAWEQEQIYLSEIKKASNQLMNWTYRKMFETVQDIINKYNLKIDPKEISCKHLRKCLNKIQFGD